MKYEVLPGHSVVTDKPYLPGEEIELDEAEGKRLQKRGIVGLVGLVEKVEKPVTAKELAAEVMRANTLDEIVALTNGVDETLTVKKAIEKRSRQLLEAKDETAETASEGTDSER